MVVVFILLKKNNIKLMQIHFLYLYKKEGDKNKVPILQYFMEYKNFFISERKKLFNK